MVPVWVCLRLPHDQTREPSSQCCALGVSSPTLMLALTPGEVRGWRVSWSASWETRARLCAVCSSFRPGTSVHWRFSAKVVIVAISPVVTCVSLLLLSD